MQKGYGFGAEGDWKTAAMVRLMKIMTANMPNAKGTSMLEDYTYNLVPGKEGILEAHMLEICPSIADGPISIKVQPLSMGDREDPARLVFTSKEGKGIATSLIDLGNRFRLIINEVNCKKVEKPMPKLPVATAFWTPEPNLQVGTEAWIYAGGAHHTAFSYDLTTEADGRLGKRYGHRERSHRQGYHYPELQKRTEMEFCILQIKQGESQEVHASPRRENAWLCLHSCIPNRKKGEGFQSHRTDG